MTSMSSLVYPVAAALVASDSVFLIAMSKLQFQYHDNFVQAVEKLTNDEANVEEQTPIWIDYFQGWVMTGVLVLLNAVIMILFLNIVGGGLSINNLIPWLAVIILLPIILYFSLPLVRRLSRGDRIYLLSEWGVKEYRYGNRKVELLSSIQWSDIDRVSSFWFSGFTTIEIRAKGSKHIFPAVMVNIGYLYHLLLAKIDVSPSQNASTDLKKKGRIEKGTEHYLQRQMEHGLHPFIKLPPRPKALAFQAQILFISAFILINLLIILIHAFTMT